MAQEEMKTRILDLVMEMIQTRGFNAMSYQQIADKIGIRTASIHYHFRTKVDLGKAVIQRYRAALQSVMDEAENAEDYERTWSVYVEPMLAMAKGQDRACLCGVLAGEYQTLSPKMQDEVKAFFIEHQAWLEDLFKRGKKAGAFKFSRRPKALAQLTFSALEGAMLIQRATGDAGQLKRVVEELGAMLGVNH